MTQFVTQMLQRVADGHQLDVRSAEDFMDAIMAGEVSPVQTAALITAMKVRGESVSEIVGFARSMRSHSVKLDLPFDVVDTCGTGGDGANTFNISTTAAFVTAASGIPVAKHGNRAVSSKSGSADVLNALGVNINLSDLEAKACLAESHLCFLFAQNFHPAMKYAAEPRKLLGFRTIFNILGPLTNPAGATRQVIGVYRSELVEKIAQVLLQLGTHHALVVHGAGGIDELSLSGENLVAEVRDGHIKTYTLTPEECGLARASVSELSGGDAIHNAEIIRQVLDGGVGPHRDVVLLNAGAALYVGGKVESIASGVIMAAELIDKGVAAGTYRKFVDASHYYQRSEIAQ
jgi:anthranilate phosphoribosyltransferase